MTSRVTPSSAGPPPSAPGSGSSSPQLAAVIPRTTAASNAAADRVLLMVVLSSGCLCRRGVLRYAWPLRSRDHREAGVGVEDVQAVGVHDEADGLALPDPGTRAQPGGQRAGRRG